MDLSTWFLILTVCYAVGMAVLIAVIWRFRKAVRDLWARIEDIRSEMRARDVRDYERLRRIYGHIAATYLRRNRPVPFHAQHGEDIWLWEYFDRETKGCYVEVGAFDGVGFSNTYAFECIGWTGILIEADPASYRLCRENRPNSTVIHAAVGAPVDSMNDTVNFARAMGGRTEMLSSYVMSEEHLSRVQREGGHVEYETVPYRSLDSILAEINPEHIDFVTIDVEGAELDVLEGFTLDMFSPCIIIVESNVKMQRDNVIEYMKDRSYKLVHTAGCNDFFVRIQSEKNF